MFKLFRGFFLTYFQIFASLAAAASAAPQIVPYVHEEIPAEPYVHEEPEISPLALGIVRPGASSYQQAAPAPSFAPTGPVGYATGPWTGGCYNSLGAGVPCRKQ